MKKILILCVVLTVLFSCGLGTDITKTLQTGGLDSDGNVPASVSAMEDNQIPRTVLGNNLLLTWKLDSRDYLASHEFFSLEKLFSHCQWEIYQDGQSDVLRSGQTEVVSRNQDYFAWIYDHELVPGQSYTWRVRLIGGDAENPYHGAWYGPYSLVPAETEILLELEEPTLDNLSDEVVGCYPEMVIQNGEPRIFYFEDGNTIRTRVRSATGEWPDGSTLDCGKTGDLGGSFGDRIELLQMDDGSWNLMLSYSAGNQAILEYLSSNSLDGPWTSQPLLGNDSIILEADCRPSMATHENTLFFLYYQENGGLALTRLLSNGTSAEFLVESGTVPLDSYWDNQASCTLLIDAAGGLHAIYYSPVDSVLYYRMSDDGGETWSVRESLYSSGNVVGTDAIMDSNGKIFLSFIAQVDGGEEKDWGLFWMEWQSSVWTDAAMLSSTPWFEIHYPHFANLTQIELDIQGNPYLLAILGQEPQGESVHTGDDSPWPASLPVILRKSGALWQAHMLDFSPSLFYVSGGVRHHQHMSFQIDEQDELHFYFREGSRVFAQDDYNTVDSLRLKYTKLDLTQLEFADLH